MDGLQLALDLVLPAEAVTSTFAMLGVRGSGKSNTGVRLAEQMHAAGLPWICVDPKGDWWGITLNQAGDGPGLPVPVIGGRHGDHPLTAGSGTALARLVVHHRLTAIFDVSDLGRSAANEWLADFLEELYRSNTEPLHLFFEEAARYFPQVLTAGKASQRLHEIGADIVKLGRQRGFGCTYLTQRTASLHNEMLTQVETLMAMRNTYPADLDAIAKWVGPTAAAHDIPKIAEVLRRLPAGEGLVVSPAWLPEHGRPEFQRTLFDRRTTYDSGATPTLDSPVKAVDGARAAIDLQALTAELEAAVDAAASDDPAVLRARIRELEQQAGRPAVTPPTVVEKVVEKTVEVPVLTGADRRSLNETAAKLEEAQRTLAVLLASVQRRSAPETAADGGHPRSRQPTKTEPGPPAAAPAPVRGGALPKAERLILTVLVHHGDRTIASLAFLAGYAPNGGGFRNALSSLRTAGRIASGTGRVAITAAGRDALGESRPRASGEALMEVVYDRLRNKPARDVLAVLVDAYPDRVTIDELAALTDYAPGGGGFRNGLSRLRSCEVAEGAAADGGMRATDDLMSMYSQ